VRKRVIHKKGKVKRKKTSAAHENREDRPVPKKDVEGGREKGEETQREERQSTERETALRFVIDVN
jgi:hypothetical protein